MPTSTEQSSPPPPAFPTPPPSDPYATPDPYAAPAAYATPDPAAAPATYNPGDPSQQHAQGYGAAPLYAPAAPMEPTPYAPPSYAPGVPAMAPVYAAGTQQNPPPYGTQPLAAPGKGKWNLCAGVVVSLAILGLLPGYNAVQLLRDLDSPGATPWLNAAGAACALIGLFGLVARGSFVPKLFGFAGGALFAAASVKDLTDAIEPFVGPNRRVVGIPLSIQIGVFAVLALLALGAGRRRPV